MYKGVQEEKEKSAMGKYREAFILIRQKRGNKWWEANKSGGRKRCKVDIKGDNVFFNVRKMKRKQSDSLY